MKKENGYAAYVNAVKKGVQSFLDKWYEGYKAQVVSMEFQGRQCNFLTIKSEKCTVAMRMNLTTTYEKGKGVGLDEMVLDAVASIREVMEHHLTGADQAAISELLNYEKIKDKLRIRMISSKCYPKYYGGAVVRKFHDMYQMVSIEVNGYSAIVLNNILEQYGVSEDELFSAAMESTIKAEGICLLDLVDTLSNMLEESELVVDKKQDMTVIWFLSNQTRKFGASVLLYPGALETVAEKLNDSFYILPSSVHEVLLITKSIYDRMFMDEEVMQRNIQEINSSMVDEKDRLSDTLYLYDRETKTLTQRLSDKREELRLNAV